MEESTMTTIHLRADGDLTLIVGEEKRRFVVSRGVVAGVCKAWHTMFTKFYEAFATEVELPDDDPESILVLLQIAHLRFDQLPPGDMCLTRLFDLATVCDKYDTVAIVRPFLSIWSESFQDRRCWATKHEQKLWVAWVFGYEDAFSHHARSLQLTISMDDDGRCVTEDGAWLDDVHMPIHLADKLVKIREDSINRFLDVCYTYIDKVEQRETKCKSPGSRMKKQCSMITLGCLVQGFHSLNLWKSRRTAADVKQSISSFYKSLQNFEGITLEEHDPWRRRSGQDISNDHSLCNPATEMLADLAKVYKDIPSAVEKFHLDRIDEQARKGKPQTSPED